MVEKDFESQTGEWLLWATQPRLRQSRCRASLLFFLCQLDRVIQRRSYWFEAPLAHLRSAGEVATHPAITITINEVPSSVIARLCQSKLGRLGNWLISSSTHGCVIMELERNSYLS